MNQKEEKKVEKKIDFLKVLLEIEKFNSSIIQSKYIHNVSLLLASALAFLSLFVVLNKVNAVLMVLLIGIILLILIDKNYYKSKFESFTKHKAIGAVMIKEYSKIGIEYTDLKKETEKEIKRIENEIKKKI